MRKRKIATTAKQETVWGFPYTYVKLDPIATERTDFKESYPLVVYFAYPAERNRFAKEIRRGIWKEGYSTGHLDKD